jgi:hypothetical protein
VPRRRFGSLADILRCGSHVRFTPKSGHSLKGAARLLPYGTGGAGGFPFSTTRLFAGPSPKS